MFTRQEASRIREEFWTVFGRYMSPIHSAEGLKVNWVNYHTRLKDVYFRMDAGPKTASICISLEHRDPGIQELYFHQFRELKVMLELAVEEEWDWQLHVPLADKVVSRICKVLPGVSVLNKEQWSELISFFKPRIIALDTFWEDARYSFDGLR
ncbi:MAG TPA: DUF4268 domain-containing protein [Chryseosolibacter sp.]